MSNSFDAVIIGAGVIGSAIAFEMSKAGKKTVNVDMLPAAGHGSTAAPCAIIRTYYSTLDGTALAYESYFHWKSWPDYVGTSDELGLAELRETGCMVMKTEHNGNLEGICRLMDQLSIAYEHWDADAVRRRIPVYDMRRYAPAKTREADDFGEPTGGELTGAVFFPNGGYINDPQLATHNLQRAAESHGAAYLFNKRVVEISKDGGRVSGVVLDDGSRLEAPVVINVAGPHSNGINKLAGADLDMKISTRALRQEVVHVPAPAEYAFSEEGLVVSDSDVAVYSRPEIGNHILIGSEDPACDEPEWVDPDDFNRDFSEQWTTQALRMAQRIPSLGIPSRMRGVVDLYDVTEDWGPIYDRSSVDGYYMAVGTSGNQFKNAPVVGALMNALVDYCEAGKNHDAEPMAFHLPMTGHTLDCRTFSRLREINADSSFSVLG